MTGDIGRKVPKCLVSTGDELCQLSSIIVKRGTLDRVNHIIREGTASGVLAKLLSK